MTELGIGLALFLVTHGLRLPGEGPRRALIARLGCIGFKVLYALLTALALVLIARGYGEARLSAELLWVLPVGVRHAASLLTVAAFLLLVAAYVPRNHLKSAIGHPMLAGVKLWALSHLLVNGSTADLLLFGTFLAWSVVLFAVLRRRDRAAGVRPATGHWAGTLATVVLGLGLWAGFALYAHRWLIGVAPFGA
ncbi:MAG TPA: protein NrnU [Gammaproteobacteria bacterium]|nr:protein NrnU [Gammaproteobacteria bacterium]